MSTSDSAPVKNCPPCCQKYEPYGQKLDMLLDALEKKLGFKVAKPQTERNNKYASELSLNEEEMKSWEMAKMVKKHNISYRNIINHLHVLQKEKKELTSANANSKAKTRDNVNCTILKDNLPCPIRPSVSLSSTSCSSLEDGPYEDVNCNPNMNWCSIQQIWHLKSPKLNNNGMLKYSSVSGSDKMQQKATKRPDQSPRKLEEEKSILPSSASANVKSKSKIPVASPIKLSQKSPQDDNSKSSTLNDQKGNGQNKQIIEPIPIQPPANSKTKTSVQKVKFEDKIKEIPTYKQSLKDNPEPETGKCNISQMQRITHRIPIRIPIPKPVASQLLQANNLAAKPSRSNVSLQGSSSKTKAVVSDEAQADGNNNSSTLSMLQDLLEHSKSVLMTVFSIDESSLIKSEPNQIPQTIRESLNTQIQNAFKENKNMGASKLKEAEGDIQTLFAVPFIPGVSRIPRPTYLTKMSVNSTNRKTQ